MTNALNEVLAIKELEYPIYGYTSERNTLDCALLEKTGFKKDDMPISFFWRIKYPLISTR